LAYGRAIRASEQQKAKDRREEAESKTKVATLSETLTFKDKELLARLQNETGTAAFASHHFHAFVNVEENVRRRIQKVKAPMDSQDRARSGIWL